MICSPMLRHTFLISALLYSAVLCYAWETSSLGSCRAPLHMNQAERRIIYGFRARRFRAKCRAPYAFMIRVSNNAVRSVAREWAPHSENIAKPLPIFSQKRGRPRLMWIDMEIISCLKIDVARAFFAGHAAQRRH